MRVAESLLLPDPDAVALMVAGEVFETLFAFTVAVAAEFSPVDVTLVTGDTVAAPVALHVTVRP